MERERPHNPPPSEEEPPEKLDRRQFIKTGLLAFAGGTVAASLGTKEFIEHQIESRSEGVAELSEFLRGRGKGDIEIFGRKFNYEQFLSLTGELLEPQKESKKTVQALLDSFTYMMVVEDRFGGKYNTLPALESLDRITEPYISTASSFGYGQINAQTARGIALKKADYLLKQKFISEAQLAKLQDNDISEHEIVDILDLRGNGNIPISFLCFEEGYDQYARTTQGKVHGLPENIRSRGRLSADRRVDPRSFGLAVSAYSAKLESPMVAKAQTYINEMLLTDPNLRERLDQALEEAGMKDKLLEVDGDMGPNTLRVFNLISEELGLPSTFVEGQKVQSQQRIQELDKWLLTARGEWRKRVSGLWNQKDKDPQTVKELVSHRYHGIVSMYNILKRMFPQKEERIRELFLGFADTRKADFVDLIDDKEKFEGEFGEGQHTQFFQRLGRTLPAIVNFDERYRGYIPMGYAAAPRLLSDPKNIMMRVLLAHESDSNSTINIPLN